MSEARQGPSWLKWLVTLIAMVGVWLLFTSKLTKPEVYAGLAAAALATVAAAAFDALGLVKFRPTLRQLAEAWRLPWYLVEGTWEILQGMYRQMFTTQGAPSFLAAVRFDFGNENARDAGRRALAIAYTSATPNFVVLGFVPKQQLMLYHQILPGDVLQMSQNLGARP